MKSNGTDGYAHVAYDLYGCPDLLLMDVNRAVSGLIEACRLADLTVVNHLAHEYPNRAYSVSLFLSESHISMHTWPEHSYCALDIFLCRGDVEKAEDSLISFLQPATKYKINLMRGSRGEIPLGHGVTTRGQPGYYEVYKTRKTLARLNTPYQLLEIVESEGFGKILLLDKDVQLSTKDEHVYHELLVHPAMQAHPAPENILVIGGGDGGALREILKYPSVRQAVLVDIDAQVVSCCRELLPEISQGSFDDPRVKIVYSDAASFCTDQHFDVVVVDLTAPQGISLPAYRSLVERIGALLKADGILTVHSGWWWSGSQLDYPSLLLEEFAHTVLKDQWVASFACFWSFIVAWKHDMEPALALRRISEIGKTIKTRHFDSSEFTRGAFINSRICHS